MTDADGAHLLERAHAITEGDPFLVTRPDLAVAPASFFQSAPRAMPTHQLAHAHLVLWGESVAIARARDDAGGAIVDPEDAAALLFNRFVESLDPGLEDEWRPENYSGKFFGPTRMRLALTKSRNLISIRVSKLTLDCICSESLFV